MRNLTLNRSPELGVGSVYYKMYRYIDRFTFFVIPVLISPCHRIFEYRIQYAQSTLFSWRSRFLYFSLSFCAVSLYAYGYLLAISG